MYRTPALFSQPPPPFLCFCFCLSLTLSLCLSVCLSVCLALALSVCLSGSGSVCLSLPLPPPPSRLPAFGLHIWSLQLIIKHVLKTSLRHHIYSSLRPLRLQHADSPTATASSSDWLKCAALRPQKRPSTPVLDDGRWTSAPFVACGHFTHCSPATGHLRDYFTFASSVSPHDSTSRTASPTSTYTAEISSASPSWSFRAVPLAVAVQSNNHVLGAWWSQKLTH